MPQDVIVRRLRPYLFTSFKRLHKPCQASAFSSYGRRLQLEQDKERTTDYAKRLAQLEAYRPLSQCYPRLHSKDGTTRARMLAFEHKYSYLSPGQSDLEETVDLAGKIRSIRVAGSKLCFLDIEVVDGNTIQAVCQLGTLSDLDSNVTADDFKAFSKVARRGDSYSIRGHPHRTARGELSVLASQLPELLSPSLHQVPDALEDAEARARNRHVDMLVNPTTVQTLQLRHEIERSLQSFFNQRDFVKVNTPILSTGAGGAAARPFKTQATEFAEASLSLRIAPELWLKRLIVGGMDKVYELGPAFRNEGVDLTHNPEFAICEFYQAYATLDDLMTITQSVLVHLRRAIDECRDESGRLDALPRLQLDFDTTFERVEFIPSLEQCLGRSLPDLQTPEAAQQLLSICEETSIPTPTNPSVSRLLDTLAATYLEPLSSSKPLFITHHPACMSPLSKHFVCPRTQQVVAARAELFIRGREYANMYEEENSPFEQRRKFEEQVRQRDADPEAMDLDESYLRALEWGMPPTGGWGCGVDRLVMLFGGRERMADVLAFGSLRNVVGLGKVGGKR